MPTAGTPQLSGQEWISVPTGGLTKEFEVELYGSTRTVSPGGLVLIRYSINSYEDQDERIRLRLYTPTGWILMDPEVEEREFLLEAWEFVEGEVRLLVPQDARPGERHKVYVLGEVVGEPGRAEVYASVQVVRRGGLRPGAAGLSGTASILATNFAMNDLRGARYGGVVDLSGKLTRDATLSLNYRQGPRENNLTNYRIAQDETRWSGTLRHPAWTLQFGNQVTSSGGVLTGPSVRGRGVIVRRVEGRLIGDLVVAEPTSFLGEAAGHVVRGSVGLSGSLGRVGVAFSDFARPAGGYSTAPRYAETIDPEEIDRLERERQALERSSRNRVQGAGLDAEIRPTKVHRVNLRGGWLQLTNAAGDTVSGPSAEAQYALHHRQGHLNVRWRRMPNSLQGIYLPGNEMAADASVRVLGEWRLAGRVYRSVQETRGNEYRSEGEGASFGVRYAAPTWRMEVSGNHRSWSYGNQPTEARTASMYFGVPLGPLHLGAHAERGYQSRENARQPSGSYRTDLRWINGGGSTASWSASYYEAFGTSPRFRTDVLGSLRLNEWEVSGGAWATRGLTFGGEPGVWSQIGIPITYDLLFTLGVEYAPPTWGQSPTWMGTVGVRKKLAVPIPFLRDPSTPVLPGTGS